jgi:hypothetical protein
MVSSGVREQCPCQLLSEVGCHPELARSPMRLLVRLSASKLIVGVTKAFTVAPLGKSKMPTAESEWIWNNSARRAKSGKTDISMWQAKWACLVNVVRDHPCDCSSPVRSSSSPLTPLTNLDYSTYHQHWVRRQFSRSGWRNSYAYNYDEDY